MFLNYLAGAVSLVLAISAFVPWVTVWFYSLKGIESVYGIIILIVGLMGITVSIFQHLSGKMRGRSFIGLSLIALVCNGLYFRWMASIGSKIKDVLGLITNLVGDAVVEKVKQLIGEQWTKTLGTALQWTGLSDSISAFDFIGNGLILAAFSALALLVIGVLIEKNKPAAE